MKGNPQVIELLNEVLTGELTAINQYFIHAKMCQNWGYKRLHAHIRHESIDEMKHADELIEHILFLDGLPNVQRLGKVQIGETPLEQFKADLKLELAAVERLNRGIGLCRDLSDNGSRELLVRILVSEESHIDWLEAQLSLIKNLGEVAYLAEQIHD